MKSRKLFDITEPYSKEQYNSIYYKVMREFGDHVCVAYQSNWYMVIACSDSTISNSLMLDLREIGITKSYMEARRGRKNKERVYVQIKFKRIR